METSVLGPSRSDPKSNQVVNYINCHQACLSLIISPSSSSILPCCPGLAVGGHEAERLLADLPRRVPEGAALLKPTGEEQDRQLHHCYRHYCTFDIVNDIVKDKHNCKLKIITGGGDPRPLAHLLDLPPCPHCPWGPHCCQVAYHDQAMIIIRSYLLTSISLPLFVHFQMAKFLVSYIWSYLFVESLIKLFLSSAWWCLRALWWPPFKS